MRRILLPVALFLTSPVVAQGQGTIIPRPCPPAVPACAPGNLVRLSNTVRITLVDRVLRYEVTEVFRNDGRAVAEADYIYPLPSGAAFEDLKLSINGGLVSGETMAADKARGIYEEIVRRQRDPALVEWMGSGMLRTRIFPIAPGEEKTVVVRYQSVAVREGDALRIDYRRGSEPARVSTPRQWFVRPVDSAGESDEGGTWSRVTLRYPRSASFGEAYSPTHSLRHRDDGEFRIVDARGTGAELTILIPMQRTNAASMSVLTHAVRGEPGFALLTITPPATAAHIAPRDFTFVVDVSGSMSGKKLTQAKAAGRSLLNSLRRGDRFRIIDFSTDVREFRENAWTDATAANLDAARRYIDELRAEGSTNISGALDIALDAPHSGSGRLPLVVFVTDGEPTVGERNPDAIAALAARKRGDARVFSVGVTAGINASLVEQLAVQGRGTAHFVRDNESVESTVALLAERLSAPVLTNVRITSDGVRLSRVMPSGPIDVFAGQDLVVLARYEGEGNATIRLHGQGPSGPVTWSTQAHFREAERANPFVPRLWAAQRIGWLAAEKRRNGGNITELDSEIRTLGERFGIPTEFSSYLVLEPGMVANQFSPSAPPPVVRGQAGGAVRSRAADASTQGAVSGQGASFEAARTAAEQRAAKSVSAIDAVAHDNTVRQVGTRRFALVDSIWTDLAARKDLHTIRVKPFSPLYFAVMQRISDLSAFFALGDRVLVGGRAVLIVLDEHGQADATTATVDRIVRDWQ